MNVKEIYKLAIEQGIKNDPRDKAEISDVLKVAAEKYKKLEKDEKEEFDAESLTNPYSDTRILYDSGKPVKTALVGIDMEVGEVLLAKELERGGTKIDLLLSHHPEGVGMTGIADVVDLQAPLFAKHGVPINIAEGVTLPRIEEVRRRFMPANVNRAVDSARLLNISLVSTHTIADNHAYQFVQNLMDSKKPKTVGDVVKILKEVPEFRKATKDKMGPTIFCGTPERKAGKVAALGFTGGTSSANEVFEKFAQAGIGTIIEMHMNEEAKKEAEKHNINVVIAGHIASDSLGMNLFLDELEKKGIKIVPCSGLIRVSRVKR